jgi:hypothetical protein
MNEKTVHQKYFGIIIFVFPGILIIPHLYYLSNRDAFNNDIGLLFIPLTLAVIVLFLGHSFHKNQNFQNFLAGLGLSILLCDQFLRPEITLLDGATREIIINPKIAALNALVFLGIPVFFVLRGKHFNKLLTNLATITTYLGLGVMAVSYIVSAVSLGNDKATPIKAPQETSNQPNIYFLWLDAMETGYMTKYLEDPVVRKDFSGFTLFKNNSSNYLYTLQSYPSFMSGTVFENGSYERWNQKGDNLRKDLSEFGYNITTYAKSDFLSSYDNTSYSADHVHSTWTKTNHPFIADFVSYWMVRSLPALMANQTLKVGTKVGGILHELFNEQSDYSEIKTIADGIEPLTGIFTLNQLTDDEGKRSSHNEFVMAQAIIPHGPFMFDCDCNFRSEYSGSTSEAYYEQVICASRLVGRFLKKLKELNRYDSSLIIIMGDHGSGWAGPVDGIETDPSPLNNEYMPWSKSKVISRASALLMVKPPKTDTRIDLIISERETQLVDIYPTILSTIGHKEKIPDNTHGIGVFSQIGPKREKFVTYFKPSRTIDPYNADVYDLLYTSNGGIYDIAFRSKLQDIDQILPLISGRMISFSANSLDNQFYISSGFHALEPWGRWSSDNISRIQFNYSDPDQTPKFLSINLSGFVHSNHPFLRAEVYLNSNPIGEIEFKTGEQNPREFRFDISTHQLDTANLNTLEFRIENPTSPQAVGLSNDPRTIGLGFRSMTLE